MGHKIIQNGPQVCQPCFRQCFATVLPLYTPTTDVWSRLFVISTTCLRDIYCALAVIQSGFPSLFHSRQFPTRTFFILASKYCYKGFTNTYRYVYQKNSRVDTLSTTSIERILQNMKQLFRYMYSRFIYLNKIILFFQFSCKNHQI